MIKVACVLRSGGIYTPDHVGALNYSVQKHGKGVAQLLCYTDMPDEVRNVGVAAIPLDKNDPGWWAVPEVFRLKGPTIIVGIDTVFVGDIRPLLWFAQSLEKHEFYMIRDLYHPHLVQSGMMIHNGDWSWLHHEFNYHIHSKQNKGEANYTVQQLRKRKINIGLLQDKFDGIYSYKGSVRGKLDMPSDAKVILFHGTPRPHEVAHPWRRENYPLTGEKGRPNG